MDGGSFTFKPAGSGTPLGIISTTHIVQAIDRCSEHHSFSQSFGTFRAGKPEVWSDTPVGRTAMAIPLDIAPDGKRFVVFPGVQAPQSGEQDGVWVTFLPNFSTS